ncbi:serine hydrolase [bacterium]|nr:serine hydrolase [bacterium]
MRQNSKIRSLLLLTVLTFAGTAVAWTQVLPMAPPEDVGMSSQRLNRVNSVIEAAVERKDIPGAVLIVGRHGKIVHRAAYGKAQLIPNEEPMTVDRIFDLASMTKPVATATSIMMLVEQGKLRLFDKVNFFIPEFVSWIDENGESQPTRIFHLLTHTSGLPPYTPADKVEELYGKPCPDSLINHIAHLSKLDAPGRTFRYSCLGFITLCEIVKRVSGQSVADFSRENIFEPLQMNDTGYKPSKDLRARLVPTEVIDGTPLRGLVHDPLAQLMDGVSGNAGLFSTADDLAIFAQMMLQGGHWKDAQILSPLTVRQMTTVYPRVAHAQRGLGWDSFSDYSTNQGDIFPIGGFGHTGYTGTSIWMEPQTDTFVIFLTNRVHPYDGGASIQLRSYVSNVVAASIIKP